MPENFPRGGSDKKGKLKRKEAKIVKAEKDLFAVSVTLKYLFVCLYDVLNLWLLFTTHCIWPK